MMCRHKDGRTEYTDLKKKKKEKKLQYIVDAGEIFQTWKSKIHNLRIFKNQSKMISNTEM